MKNSTLRKANGFLFAAAAGLGAVDFALFGPASFIAAAAKFAAVTASLALSPPMLALAVVATGAVLGKHILLEKKLRPMRRWAKIALNEDDKQRTALLAHRNLTDGEKAYVRSIFGNEISSQALDRLTVRFAHQDEAGQTMLASVSRHVTDGIDFYGGKRCEADYSQPRNVSNAATFIHEMTHIWQHIHPLRSRGIVKEYLVDHWPRRFSHYDHTYYYKLKPTSCFKRFGIEQQASMVQDYALRFLFNEQSCWIENTAKNDRRLRKVVERQFPAARATRLGIEARR